jgi:hypothetical protein
MLPIVKRLPLIIEADPEDPDCASVLVDGTIAGRPYRFVLDTGTARTKIVADEFTATLTSRADIAQLASSLPAPTRS